MAHFRCQRLASTCTHPQTGLNTNRHHVITPRNHKRQEPGTPRTRCTKNQVRQQPGMPRTRNAKNQVRQEPGMLRTRYAKNQVPNRSNRNSPTVTNRHCCCPNRQELSGAVTNRQQDLSLTPNKAVLPSFYRRPVWAEPQAQLQLNPACLLAHCCTRPPTVHSHGHSLLTIERDAAPN